MKFHYLVVLPILIFIAGAAFSIGYGFGGLSAKPQTADLISYTGTGQTSNTTTTTALSASSSATSTVALTTRYEYKMARNIDPCTLHQLGSAGWQIFQIGSVTDFQGYASDCKSFFSDIDGIDWALFQRIIQ